ncbi:MAG: PAS domain S-box protein, partial [Sneathiella sp.]
MNLLTKEKKSQLEDFHDLISDWLWKVDIDQNLIYSNDVLEAQLDKLGQNHNVCNIVDFFENLSLESPHQNRTAIKRLNNSLLEREDFSELHFVVSDTDGQRVKLVLSARAFFNDSGQYAGHRGIGKFVFHEKQMSEKSEQLRVFSLAVESSPNGVMITDAMGVIEYANPRFSAITGFSREECYGKTPAIINSGRTSAAKYAEIWGTIKNGDIWNGTVYNKRKNGELYWCQETVSPVKKADGTISNYIAIQQDVTFAVEAEEALKLSRERFKGFAEAASDWYWETDSKLCFTFISDPAQDYSGMEMAEMLGLSRTDLVTCHEDMLMWQDHIQDLDARRPFKDFTYTFLRLDGAKRRWQISGKPIFSSSKEFLGYRGVGKDITFRTDLEDQLRQSQKMEVVGHLTGGIAHDFNNLLAIIMGNAELLIEEIDEAQGQVNKYLENILFAAKSGANITSQLLMFSKKQPLTPAPICLNKQIIAMEHILRSSMGDNISIRQDFVENAWTCFVDPDQFANAVLNLFINARDAMENAGCLTISLKNKTVKEDVRSKDLTKGHYVCLMVGDNGSGMSPEVLKKVFEPFYTTKDNGKGTG